MCRVRKYPALWHSKLEIPEIIVVQIENVYEDVIILVSELCKSIVQEIFEFKFMDTLNTINK